MSTDLNGWHPGEIAVQRKLGYEDAVRTSWQLNVNFMREQHRIFHTSNLPFIPVLTLDDSGRPWGSILAGQGGQIGFVKSPDSQTLIARVETWKGDPVHQTCGAWLAQKPVGQLDDRYLIAGIGIEFSTRRRNKFAGWISGVNRTGYLGYELTFRVNQALG